MDTGIAFTSGLLNYIVPRDINFEQMTYHSVSSWTFDKNGNIEGIIKSELPNYNAHLLEGLNLKHNINIDSTTFNATDLFPNNYMSDNIIKINKDSLQSLINNFKYVLIDIQSLIDIIEANEKNNEALLNNKSNRITTLKTYIIQHLEHINIVNIIKKIDRLFAKVESEKSSIKKISNYRSRDFIQYFFAIEQSIPGFLSWFNSQGEEWSYGMTAVNLHAIATAHRHLLSRLDLFVGKGDIRGTLGIETLVHINVFTEIGRRGESTINRLKDDIERVFQGAGNRSHYDDGIVKAIKEVMQVEKNNFIILQQYFNYLIGATEKIIVSMDEVDNNLSHQNYSMPNVTIAKDYTKFLKTTQVFDDCKVITSFDNQVDEQSEALSSRMISALGDYLNYATSKSQEMLQSLEEVKDYIHNLEPHLGESIFYKTRDNKNMSYFTVLGEKISIENILRKNNHIYSQMINEYSATINLMEQGKNNLSSLKPLLRHSVEEVIYGYDNLTSVLNSHKIISNLLNKINTQASNFNTLLQANSGATITSFSQQIEEVMILTKNVKQMIDQCFGE